MCTPSDSADTRRQVQLEWVNLYSRDGKLQVFSSSGCQHCDNTGFRGRVGIHELMIISRDLRRLIHNGARSEELQATALSAGMRTLRQDGIAKVLSGQTTIEEVRATSNV